jgi:hypothetical protein
MTNKGPLVPLDLCSGYSQKMHSMHAFRHAFFAFCRALTFCFAFRRAFSVFAVPFFFFFAFRRAFIF